MGSAMANDLIEKVARRIAKAHGRNPDECAYGSAEMLGTGKFGSPVSKYKCHRHVWENFIPHAQAAIDTIRAEIAEPNEAMQVNGYVYTVTPIACWQSILSASPLGEKEG